MATDIDVYFCDPQIVARLKKIKMKRLSSFTLISIFTLLWSTHVLAAEDRKENSSPDLNYAQVTYVKLVQSDDGSWCIHTTVHHNDEGWDHYANAWQVLDEEDSEIAWRLLAHPHDDEQPFTRSKCSINIPPDITKLRVRAKCKVHGFGGYAVIVDMSVVKSEKYRIIRKRQ